jgi:hypothetical protein
MSNAWLRPLIILLVLVVTAGAQEAPRGRDQDRKASGKGGRGGGAGVEPAVVPEYRFNTWLCRPGADQVTVSVIAWEPMEVFIAYGEDPTALTRRTETVALTPGEPRNLVLTGLRPDAAHAYQLTTRAPGGRPVADAVRRFHTQRAPGSAFTFVVQADSHLDTNTNVRVYRQTLANMLEARPDFMVDLGDTTMVDKFGRLFTKAELQYLAQRYHIGLLAHSTPVFLALGNHDGEKAERLDGGPNSMPLWSLARRKKYFPNPEPGGIYTGNATPLGNAGLLQNYYAWEWGDAQFIVLDPFWATGRERGGGDNWNRTLGEAQYRWLTRTLEESRARYRFVFLHHLIGGLDRDVRGGIVNVPYLEWGGRNSDGTDGFARNRPGWPLPIHQLLLRHGVSAVFHGHDHLYVREEADGIVYQEVPQPGHPNGHTRSAADYRYKGEVRPASGHLRVTVSPEAAKVEYIFTTVPGVTGSRLPNGSVQHSYEIVPRPRRP